MHIDTLVEGPFGTNTYLVSQERRAVVIDPGFAADSVTALVAQRGLALEAILVTHGHVDHVYGAMAVQARTGAPLFFPDTDLYLANGIFNGMIYDVPVGYADLRGGQILDLLGISFSVIFTPGHTPGEVSFHVGDTLFSGDTLFAGTIGRTDFPGGDHDTLLNAIRQEIFTLPDDTRVLPGHGPPTTVAEEKRSNPFFLP